MPKEFIYTDQSRIILHDDETLEVFFSTGRKTGYEYRGKTTV
jgi:hypothetical protein